MTNSRILMVVAVALLAAVAIFALARKNEVASQPFLNPASAPIVPASNFAGSSGEMPWYASRPAVRTIEQPPPPRPVVQTYTEAPSRHHHHEVVRKRKTKHSVAIVAGSAGMVYRYRIVPFDYRSPRMITIPSATTFVPPES